MIKMVCPNAACGKLSAVKEEYAGKRAKCPACGTLMIIPRVADIQQALAAARGPASSPPMPPRPAPPPLEEKVEAYDDEPKGLAAKSRHVTAIAIVSFILGGLAVLEGLVWLLWNLIFPSKGTAIVTNLSPDKAEKLLSRAHANLGVPPDWVVTFILILNIMYLIWGSASITVGIGVLNRRKWGRLLALVVAGFAGVLGLVSLVPVFSGHFFGLLGNFVLYIAYAAWVCLVMTRTSVVREFSQNPASRGA